MHGFSLRNVVRRWRRESAGGPRLQTLLKRYRALAEVEPETIQRNTRAFLRLIEQAGNVRSGAMTRLMATQFQASLRTAGMKPATVKSYCAGVSSVFGWGIGQFDGLSTNPFKGLRPPKVCNRRPQTYSQGEMERLYQAIQSMQNWPSTLKLQWTALVMTLDVTGMRINEATTLDWDSIDLDNRCIRIRPRDFVPGESWQWDTKGHRERAVPMTEDLYYLWTRLSEVCPWRYPLLTQERCEYLQQRSERLSSSTRKRPYGSRLYRLWHQLCKRAQVKSDGAFHGMRRTAASGLAALLAPAQLQELFGWQCLSTAEHYLNLNQDQTLSAGRRAMEARTAGEGI